MNMTDQYAAEAPTVDDIGHSAQENQDAVVDGVPEQMEAKGDPHAGDKHEEDPGAPENGTESSPGDLNPATPFGGDEVGQGASAKTPRPPRPPGSIRQARRDKRRASWERKKALAKQTKREERERREEEMRKAGVDVPAEGKLWRDLPPEEWSVSQKVRMAKKRDFEDLARSGGYRVCVDMAFEELMAERARASLVQQILYLYGSNRKATQPCLVTLSGVGSVMLKAVRRLSGFDTWLGVTTDSRCYTELFEKEELVYLSADSPNTITELEKGKVYIIGGLVDRNAHKGLCFRKATDQGIATAKLPLKKEDLRDAHAKVLATNHVFDILVRAMGSGGDLRTIEAKALPPRKRAGWTGGDERPVKKASSIDSVAEGNSVAGDGTGTDDAAISSCRKQAGLPSVEHVGGGVTGTVESEARTEASVELETSRESPEPQAGGAENADVEAGKGVGSVSDGGAESADEPRAEDAVDVPCGAQRTRRMQS